MKEEKDRGVFDSVGKVIDLLQELGPKIDIILEALEEIAKILQILSKKSSGK